MKVLLFGGSGQLGADILARWGDVQFHAPSHAQVDIADSDAVAHAVDALGADLIVNCAAFHNVDQCEREPEKAFLYNATSVDRLAQIAQQRDLCFVTISTDYVFGGEKRSPYTEDDEPNPLSTYARSKLEGEASVLKRDMRAFVVRTCGVYGSAGSRSKGTFIDRVINSAQAGEPLRVVDDVVASPTFSGHLANALRALVETRNYGLYHAVNRGAITWHEYALEVLRQVGSDYAVEAISASAWKAVAVRPAYSALATTKLETMGITMPSWEAGIAGYLQEKRERR